MSRPNRRSAKRQDANRVFGDKIGAAVGSLSALYLLPAVAQAGSIVHNPGPGPSLDLSAFFNQTATWSVDGTNPAFALVRNATSRTHTTSNGSSTIITKTYRSGTLLFNSALNGRGFLTTGAGGGRLAALKPAFSIGNTLTAYAWGGPAAALAHRSQSLSSGFTNRDSISPYFPDGTNFIGFRFLNPSDGNKVDYGWALLAFDSTNNVSAAVQDWAYACGGDPIAAGQTSTDTSCSPTGGGTVPEPSPLALLALGAVGLAAFRRRHGQREASASTA